jgi:hypothetical protein
VRFDEHLHGDIYDPIMGDVLSIRASDHSNSNVEKKT